MTLLNADEIGNGIQNQGDPDDVCVGDHVRAVKYISLLYFRQQLVVHFKIMFEGIKLVWPRSHNIVT